MAPEEGYKGLNVTQTVYIMSCANRIFMVVRNLEEPRDPMQNVELVLRSGYFVLIPIAICHVFDLYPHVQRRD